MAMTTDLTELDRLLAEFMGYMWDSEEEVWIADGWMVVSNWRPTSSIEQAMQVAEKIASATNGPGAYGRLQLFHQLDGEWAAAYGVGACYAETPALAICLAARSWIQCQK